MDINNKHKAVSFEQKPDVFIKNDSPQSFSVDDIVELLSDYSFIDFVDNIVDKGQSSYSDFSVLLYTQPDYKPIVHMGIENQDTGRTEQYKFSLDEFTEIINRVKEQKLEEYPDGKAKIEASYLKLMDKFESMKQTSKTQNS